MRACTFARWRPRASGAGAGADGSVSSAPAYYPWIDPLRAFAALSVVLFHLYGLAALAIPPAWPWHWFRVGFLGVDLFFAISGAVIVLSVDALQRRHGAGWRRPFGWRRLVRIVPLYLVTGVLFVLLVQPDLLQRPDFVRQALSHLLFVHNLSLQTSGVINGPSWSLGVEMQFYLLILLAGGVLLSLRGWLLALLLLGLAAGWRAALLLVHAQQPDLAIGHYANQLPGVIDGFGLGMLAACWRLRQGAVVRRRYVCALAIGAVLLWIAALALMQARIANFLADPLGLIGAHALVALAAGCTVAAALAAPVPRRWPRWLKLSGDLSYGLYLWHLGVLLLVMRALPAIDPGLRALLVVAATVAIAALGWFALERPLLRRAHRARNP